ncbi:MAG: hypothetical protein RIQ51_1824 [Bacteroidota bacterium]|jgi:hypothetical protein
MKKLFLIIMALMAFNSYSKEFEVEIDRTKTPPVAKYVHDDWVFLKHENDYSFYVNNGGFEKAHSDLIMVYTLLIFDKPRQVKGTDIMIDKIYSFGLLDCNLALFSLIGELYTDVGGVIHQNTLYEEGQYVVKMDSPDTARKEAYLSACVNKRI